MSITFDIMNLTPAQRDALESEGYEYANFSNSNALRVMELLGLDADYVGECDPDDILMSVDDARSRHSVESDDFRISMIAEVARAARGLGRQVSWG